MRRNGRMATLTVAVVLLAGAVMAGGTASVSAASGDVKTTVVIEAVSALSLIDSNSAADFYAKVWIDGRHHRSAVMTSNIIYPNWTFVETFPQTRASVPVRIEIWDEDDFLNGADNIVDITPGPGSSLDLNLVFEPCRVTGQAEGACMAGLVTDGGGAERASVRFRLEAENPALPESLFVRCLHSPLWPQPGDTITVSAEPREGQAGSMAGRRADTVEIWMRATDNPAASAAQQTSLAASTGAGSAPGTFTYGCRVVEDGLSVFSGWRAVQVGPPPSGKAIPVIYNGRAEQGVDVVFVPDADDFEGADANFQQDVTTLLRDGLYDNNAYLRNQHRLNIWLAPDEGQAGGWTVNPAGAGSCSNTAPANRSTDYTFADAMGLIHRSGLRDCAGGGVFSSQASNARVVGHEMGHAPFGMSDEYCCDGGYWQPPREPNAYSAQTACQNDAPPGATCRQFTVNGGGVWWTSDPATNDLMVDNGWANFLDRRRIDAHFAGCSAAC